MVTGWYPIAKFFRQNIGADWISLLALGILMALLSFFVDYSIERCLYGKGDKYIHHRFVLLWASQPQFLHKLRLLCMYESWFTRYAPIICKPRVPPPPPPPRETTGDLTASFYQVVGSLTMRWVMGVGHIDQRHSELRSLCIPLTDSMDQVLQTYRTFPGSGWGWLTILSLSGGSGKIPPPPPPPQSNPTISRGSPYRHAIEKCIRYPCTVWHIQSAIASKFPFDNKQSLTSSKPCAAVRLWLYEAVTTITVMQYVIWVLYPALLIVFGVGFTHIVSPPAIGTLLCLPSA